MNYEKQEEETWCWAACVEMILKHFGVSDDEQCEIAQTGLSLLGGGSNCCTSNNISNHNRRCDRTLDQEKVTELWSKYPVKADFKRRSPAINLPLFRDELQDMLDSGHPVEIGYRHPDMGHLIILCGWEQYPETGQATFFYHDPITVANVLMDESNIRKNHLGRLSATWRLSKRESEEDNHGN
ncbi:MAG: hypothetical protein L0229_27345 [Blastocatellia bacterium]|nr:hypothetical protein [Blastocatellia bacterium]